jgi:basic amino acid/polyamine antiporter, APA family
VLLLVPPATLAESNAPFVDLTSRYWGPHVGKLVAVLAAVSAFGALNGWILLQGELPRAMAANGVFPRVFARESAHQTPTFGLCFGSAVATFLVLANFQRSMVGIFTFMALISTTACLVMYALCSAALLRLQWTQQLGSARRGSIPLAIVGIVATTYSLWAIVGAGAEAVGWGAALLLLGVPLYYWLRRSHSIQGSSR